MAKRQTPSGLPYGPSVDKVMLLYGFSEGQYNTAVQGVARNSNQEAPIVTVSVGSEGATKNQNLSLRDVVAKDTIPRTTKSVSVHDSGAVINGKHSGHLMQINKIPESDRPDIPRNFPNDKKNRESPGKASGNFDKV